MPAQSIWVEIIEITLYACLVKLGGRIGCKSLRLHCMPAWSNWVEIIEITLYAYLVE